MAILMQLQAPQWSPQQYEQLANTVAPGGKMPDGCLVHVAAPLPGGGVQVVDVWESREAMDRFTQQSVMPAAERLGMQPGQEPQVVEILNYLTR
jgi:hypothetical protein